MRDQQDQRAPGRTLTFVACVSDVELLRSNLLASPCLGHELAHEVILVRNCESAAEGLNLGIGRAAGGWVVGVHQDVFLPAGWDVQLSRQLQDAQRLFAPIGVAGVYGVGPAIRRDGCLGAERVGWVNDRGRELREASELPARVAPLDELLLVVPKDTPLRFDPELGFHLYGADLCLQAAERGLAVVVIEAACEHNSRSIGLSAEFFNSAEMFARKWQHRLPVATPCVIIDEERRVWVLGNSSRPLAATNF
jgi:Glycosyltransferase like family